MVSTHALPIFNHSTLGGRCLAAVRQDTDRNLLFGRSAVQGELLLRRVDLVPVLRLFEGMAKAF